MSDMNFGVNLLPVTDSTYALGSDAKRWSGIFVDEINGMDPESFGGASVKRYTVTIPTTGWTLSNGLYHVSVFVPGIREDDQGGGIGIVQTGTESTDKVMRENWNKITRITTSANNITVYATEVPSASIPILIEVFRAGAESVISLEDAVITLETGTLTYDGTEKTKAVSSVTVDGVALIENTDYVVIGNKATNAGTYTLSVLGVNEYGGSASAEWTIAKATGSVTVDPATLTIQGVRTSETVAVTAVGDGTLSVSSSDTNVASVEISGTTVTVTCEDAGSATVTITMLDGTNYLGSSATVSVTCSTVQVFGVVWNYANSSTALTRLTPSTDPNSYVNATIDSEPSPAIGTGSGSSPFDTIMPWSGMEEYSIVDNAVGPKKGETGFSRTSNDVMVYIPPFYYKIIKDTSNSKHYFYVANGAITGFELHPGSGCYVGKYHTISNSGYYSRSGSSPYVNMTRATARTNSHNKGSNWYQWGIAQWNAIQLLYIVEFADWNSQSKIAPDYTNTSNSAAISTGNTDTMTYHTGRSATSTADKASAQYRWIEGLWGNVLDWLDGVNMNARTIYVCKNPANFADNTSTNYTSAGFSLPSSGYITGLGNSSSESWLMLPNSASSGSNSTYIPDYVFSSSSGWYVAFVGGAWNYGLSAGLFQFVGNDSASGTYSVIGSRLLFTP